MKVKLWKKATKDLRIRYNPLTLYWYLELKGSADVYYAVSKSATVKGIIAKKHDHIRNRANDYLAGRGII